MVFHYLKFFMFHLVGLLTAMTMLAGGHWISVGTLLIVGYYIVGDAVLGDDTSTPDFQHTTLLTVQLWLALPLLCFMVFCSLWSVASADLFGFGHWLTQLNGYDLLAAREATAWFHHLSGMVLMGLMIGVIGTIPGHELTHRTWDRVSMLIGRWLLAFSLDTAFSIEHVYGHHRYVATTADPATAPRGRNVYAHIVISTLRGNLSAWRIESARLKRRHHHAWSWRNRLLRGYLMSALLMGLAYALGGWVTLGYFVLVALLAKAFLEVVNYMEHYGMVRLPDEPVQPRHSWNTNRRISSWAMFNLTRHSHHHAQGEVPYQDLKPYPDAPQMIGGYLTTLVVALIPPLWHWLMIPKLRHWDAHFASEPERRLVARANRESGLAPLLAQAPQTDAPDRQ
ncbi:alkane 1-monooxygenase [Ferrimonas balearica]|uniref:alkane 1-monooxygenase n=1 Tax=Ferrimonas balearica TaxID=44012 RepID=UPI001C584B08|nr:alkane 1-monooxygenase [Ferrimonas balearica]MBW3163634.1 alkane 1-monooxygenase [Ferrimonas balearica]